jgi:hypothetical protein
MKKNPNQRHPSLSNREWVEFRNVAKGCYGHGKSQLLHLRRTIIALGNTRAGLGFEKWL